MLRRRIHRLSTAIVVVMSLLLAQLALASHVCPQRSGTQAMGMAMTAGMSCDGMYRQQPTLCHQHAADPGKTFEAVKLPTVSLPTVVQVLALALVVDTAEAAAPRVAATREARPPPDPLFLATLRLRV